MIKVDASEDVQHHEDVWGKKVVPSIEGFWREGFFYMCMCFKHAVQEAGKKLGKRNRSIVGKIEKPRVWY